VQQGQEAPGGDHHDMWIDPTNANRMVVGHDQGVSVSQTRGRTWLKQRLPNAQLYHVTVDNQIPYYIYTNKQDGPSYRGPSNSRLDEGGRGGGGGGGRSGIPRGMWQSTDGGQSWQEISPDVTLNDKSRQQSSGGLTPDNIGVEYGGVIHAIAESPKQAGVIWVGTNDGLVQLTRDGGKTWSNVTKNIPNLPPWGTVGNIEASRYDAGAAYIAVEIGRAS